MFCAIGCACGLLTIILNQVQQHLDNVAEKPHAQFVQLRVETGGALKVTVRNTSSTDPLAITSMSFTVTDPELLRKIQHIHARPQSPVGPSDKAETNNPVNNVYFREGYWDAQSYCFDATLGIHVPPSAVEDVTPVIISERWDNFIFEGALLIYFNEGGPLKVDDLTILGTRDSAK